MADEEQGAGEPAKTVRSARQRVKQAEHKLAENREELVEAQSELRALKSRDIPQMVVEVLPNVHIQHGGKNYHGAEYGVRYDDDGNAQEDRTLHGDDHGTVLVLDGPTAMGLVLEGKVYIERSLRPDEKPADVEKGAES